MTSAHDNEEQNIRSALAAGRPAEALQRAAQLVAGAPDDARLRRLHATCLTANNDPHAESAWREVLTLAPDDTEALFQLGNLAGDRGQFAAAASFLRRALDHAPSHPQILNNLGLALEATGALNDAERCFAQLLARHPAASAEVLPSLARVLFAQRKYQASLPHLDTLVKRIVPRDAMAWAARAVCLADTGRDQEAEHDYRHALELDPQQRSIWHDLVRFLVARDRFEDAATLLARGHAALPDDFFMTTMLAACRLRIADWRDVDALRTQLIEAIARTPVATLGAVPAYDFLALCDDPSLQRRVAQSWAAGEMESATGVAPAPRPAKRQTMRMGFVSADFGNHPVGRLVVNLFERLDRKRFEIHAYATAESADNPQRQRIVAAVDRYRSLPRRDIATSVQMLRDDRVDLLFDLNGFSGAEALRLFSQRPCAVQVSFLGYPGTLGSSAYDFIVSDARCIPAQMREHYAEEVLYHDPCYLPSDPDRAHVQASVTRDQYGLPDEAPVFCAFAATYKIVPEMFACWLRMLDELPTSMLWLRHAPARVVQRLRGEVDGRGIDPDRLRFAPAEALPRYLARFSLADVFLDTAPYGAHTTLNDALFIGLPAVTLEGNSFAARASASQLHAIGLPELAATSLDDYVAQALAIAGDRGRRSRLARYLTTEGRGSALFDMERYARIFGDVLEAAYARRLH